MYAPLQCPKPDPIDRRVPSPGDRGLQTANSSREMEENVGIIGLLVVIILVILLLRLL